MKTPEQIAVWVLGFVPPQSGAARVTYDRMIAAIVADRLQWHALSFTDGEDLREGLHDDMAHQWHEASDHGKDGTPFGGYLCNCERIAERAVRLGWGGRS